jgi:hypothetical protein
MGILTKLKTGSKTYSPKNPEFSTLELFSSDASGGI